MKRASALLKAFVAATMLLGMMAFAVPQASAFTGSWIYIHKAECPTNVTGDIFDECHDQIVQGVEFTFNGLAAKPTNTKGVTKFKVAAGTVEITELDFLNIATAGKAFVYCSVQPTGQPVLYAKNTTTGTVKFKVKNGQKVVCDWYNRTTPPPAEAAITIHKADCKLGVKGNIFDACHDNGVEGVDFDINGVAVTTDADGVASADVVADPDGTVTIAELDFATLATAGRAYVYCSVQNHAGEVLFAKNTKDGDIEIKVWDGAEVVCDWYNRVK